MKQYLLFPLFLHIIIPAYSQWTQTNITEGFLVFDLFPREDTLYASLGGAVFSTTDEGETWTYLTEGLSNIGFSYSLFANNAGLFTGTLSSGVSRSTDFGRSWEKLDDYIPADARVPDIFGNDTLLFAVTQGDGIFKSIDQGNSWRKTVFNSHTSGTSNLWTGMILDSVIIITSSNGIYRSTDQGEHWNAVNIGGFEFQNIAILGADIFVADTGSGVYRSSNGGINWQWVDNGLGTRNINALLSLNQENLIAAAQDNLYLYDQTAQRWAPLFPDEPSFQATALAFHNDHLYAGTSSLGIWKRGIGNLISSETSATRVKAFSLYPNPARTEITLEGLFTQEIHEVYITSSLGEIVEVFRGAPILAPTITLNIQDLPGGLYFCVIRGEERIHSIPFIKN